MNIWDAFLITPLTISLHFFYQILWQNLGVAIIALTAALKIVLFPLTLPALRSAKLQQEIRPQLEKLKKKYKDDRQGLAQAQMELFRQKGINPLASLLPTILQIVLLIAFYQVLFKNLTNGTFNIHFLFWDLSKRDPSFVLPVLAAGAQFILSKMMLPQATEEHVVTHKAMKAKAESKTEDFAAAFQKQNLYIFPLLTLVFGLQFPSGLMLYWLTSTVFQIPQQWWATRSSPFVFKIHKNKYMDSSSSSKKNESAILKLSNKIFENSLLCAESLKPNLEEKFGKDNKEFYSKYILVLFEFMYFFLHLTSRSAFSQLGPEKRNKLTGELVPLMIADTTRTLQALFGHWPKNLKDRIERDFYNNLNNAEMEYGSCKELLLKPEDDTPLFEKMKSGKKSKSMVGQLIDNLSQIIEGKINLDILFEMKIWDVVIEILKKKEIDSLVLEVGKEIK